MESKTSLRVSRNTAIGLDEAAILDALERLGDDNELLKVVSDATGAGTFDYNPKTGRKYWSPNTRKHFGVDAERTATHDLFLQCLHPDDRERVRKVVQDVLKPGSGGFYHTNYRTIGLDDGQLRYISATGRVLFDSSGHAVRFVGTTVDLTEHKQLEADTARRQESERQLRLLNDRFEMALRGAPIVLFCQDLDLRYTWIHNPALGHDVSAVIGKRDVDLFERSEDALRLEEIKTNVIDTGIGQRQEVAIASQGKLLHYDLLVEPLMEDGRVAGVHCAALDISTIKNAERQTRENEDRLKLGMDVSQVALAEVDYRTGQNHLSAAAARLFGLGENATVVPRAKVHSSFHPDDQIELTQRIAECLNPAGKGWFDMDHRVIWPDGQVRWLRVRKQVFFEGDGASRRPVRAMLAAMDITDLANAKAQAEANSREKDRFLAMLSHELRTPLAPVLIALDHLASDPSLSSEQVELLEMVLRNVMLEVRLIDDLLDITRISSNKLTLKKTLVDAHKTVSNVVRILAEDITARELTVRLHTDAVMHHIQADDARLQQIIWNLLKNAIKFTPLQGSIDIRTTNDATGSLQFAITDSGIGISPEVMHKIFEAFEQGGELITRHYGGLGLGLAISKALIEIHGGVLTAISPGAGQGATFSFSVPNATAYTTVVELASPKNREKLNCSILLVEDHLDTRKLMVRLLKSMGCQVEAAGSVAEALALANNPGNFSLVISDIGLPDGSGVELLQQLKQQYHFKCVALSGYGMEDDLLRSKASGFDAHLVKPVSLDELKATIRELTHPAD